MMDSTGRLLEVDWDGSREKSSSSLGTGDHPGTQSDPISHSSKASREKGFSRSTHQVGDAGWIALVILCALGVLAIWIVMTGHFGAFELDWFTLIAVVAPTISTIHLLFLHGRLLANADSENCG